MLRLRNQWPSPPMTRNPSNINPIALPSSADLSKAANRCLGYVNRYGDGLSLDHLSALLPKIPKWLLRHALVFLVQNDLVIHANNDWYYPMEEPKFETFATTLSIRPMITTESIPALQPEPLSTSEKIRHWFEQRPVDAAPIDLNDLVEICDNVNRSTVTKALKKLLDDFQQESLEKFERLDAAVLRRKAIPTQKAALSVEPAEITTPALVVEAKPVEESWVAEFRNRLVSKRIPEHASEWRETLQQMDGVFAELGVPETQRARKHIQELVEWLA